MGTTQQLATIERLVDLMGDTGSDVHHLRVFFKPDLSGDYLNQILDICNRLFLEPNSNGIVWTVKKITSFSSYLKIEKNGRDTSRIWIQYVKDKGAAEGYCACFDGPLVKDSGTSTFIGGMKFDRIHYIVAERLNLLPDASKQ